MYADGGGLYLQVSASGSKSWVFRYTANGKKRDMGLGAFHAVSLAEARLEADKCRRSLRTGIDPIESRKAVRDKARLDAVRSVTFAQCAEGYIKAHQSGWRNEKHASQWKATLSTYAEPTIGALSVDAVDTALVMKVLEQEVRAAPDQRPIPFWSAKPETASRLRGRIEAVLNWATARGFRNGENPARWKGHLENLLPPRSKLRKVEHHPALPYDKISAFISALRQRESVSARALEFLILTAARTGEVLDARWDEVNLRQGIWTIPSERMKGGKEHRVPLSSPALAVLNSFGMNHENERIFPGIKKFRPLSNMALLALLRRMGYGDLTVHGFRSTFREWTAERTNFPREVAEMALAHAVSDKVEAAYRRGDLFEKRRQLMNAWARYCGTKTEIGNVVPISVSA
jgi:integrase